ncbi:MAG: putative thioredoxin [Herminiimonas sp.]|nr:putative thioredoxin [Herminiimonas sp.]
MKRNLASYALIGLIFAAAGIYFGIHQVRTETPAASATANFFAQTLTDPQGASHPLIEWKGKALVINFWATWCAPCVQEMPELSALQTELTSKNIQIIGIGIDSTFNILEFSSKYKINYPLYVAGVSGTDLLHRFGNQAGGLPFTVLINPDGQVKKTYLGRLKLEELRKDLALL